MARPPVQLSVLRAHLTSQNAPIVQTCVPLVNRIEAQFRALRYFTLAGTDHPDHATQARLIRRYIHWRNRNTDNPRLKRLINTANVA